MPLQTENEMKHAMFIRYLELELEFLNYRERTNALEDELLIHVSSLTPTPTPFASLLRPGSSTALRLSTTDTVVTFEKFVDQAYHEDRDASEEQMSYGEIDFWYPEETNHPASALAHSSAGDIIHAKILFASCVGRGMTILHRDSCVLGFHFC
ncbi:unnamed protein product [Amoebophrya sp. A25]|nr:unnamed protein product [Amoebophrya sp. A25]|eukprot:GSA25T00017748001.1